MRILKLELKRILTTRTTWILLGIALILSVCMAYIPTTFYASEYTDENGNQVKLSGLKAFQYQKSQKAGLEGEVTPKKVRDALEAYQNCLNEYGVKDTYDLPEGVYGERIAPYTPLIHGLKEAFADPKTGMAPSLMEIDPEKAEDFYSKCDERIVTLMEAEQRDHPAAQEKAVSMYHKVEKPFTFYLAGSDSNRMDYQLLLSFMILLFCTVIAAPVFSSEYQTGADDILRCTKHGRGLLGMLKIVSAMCICGTAFALCSAVFIIVSNCLFGWEAVRTSIQMIFSTMNLADMNMGQLQTATALAGLLCVLASVSLTLFLSSRTKNMVMSIAVSLLFCFLPVIIYVAIPNDLGTWLNCIIPTGGLGMQSSFLYAMADFEFLNVGDFAVWTPYAYLFFEAVAVPVLIGLTIHSYSTHKIK